MKGSNKKYWGTFFCDGAIRLSLCKSHSDMVILYWQLIAKYFFFQRFLNFLVLGSKYFPTLFLPLCENGIFDEENQNLILVCSLIRDAPYPRRLLRGMLRVLMVGNGDSATITKKVPTYIGSIDCFCCIHVGMFFFRLPHRLLKNWPP